MTEPQNWSANAMYQATRIFSSNMTAKKVKIFYQNVLLPRARDDIRKNRRLHFALYQSLKKSLYKPAAFNKGILFPLCEVFIYQLMLRCVNIVSVYSIFFLKKKGFSFVLCYIHKNSILLTLSLISDMLPLGCTDNLLVKLFLGFMKS